MCSCIIHILEYAKQTNKQKETYSYVFAPHLQNYHICVRVSKNDFTILAISKTFANLWRDPRVKFYRKGQRHRMSSWVELKCSLPSDRSTPNWLTTFYLVPWDPCCSSWIWIAQSPVTSVLHLPLRSNRMNVRTSNTIYLFNVILFLKHDKHGMSWLQKMITAKHPFHYWEISWDNQRQRSTTW